MGAISVSGLGLGLGLRLVFQSISLSRPISLTLPLLFPYLFFFALLNSLIAGKRIGGCKPSKIANGIFSNQLVLWPNG